MSTPRTPLLHRAVSGLIGLFALGLAAIVVVSVVQGFSYYATPDALRHDHPLHALFRGGGMVGLSLGLLGTTLMVGDRCNTDIAFGNGIGWKTMLVLSGCHSRADIAKASTVEVPDYVADSVADLAACL